MTIRSNMRLQYNRLINAIQRCFMIDTLLPEGLYPFVKTRKKTTIPTCIDQLIDFTAHLMIALNTLNSNFCIPVGQQDSSRSCKPNLTQFQIINMLSYILICAEQRINVDHTIYSGFWEYG